MNPQPEGRIVVQFSCGAASAVAAKLTLAEFPLADVRIVNAFLVEEHEDNRRFLKDCEKWLGRSVTVLADTKYGASTDEVWKRRRFIKGPHGAPCSMELKRKVLAAFSLDTDAWVIGFTDEEYGRWQDLIELYPGRRILCPLIDRGLKKSDCLAIIADAGIELPAMYRLGFNNANCIGCPKGGAGYWNKIRQVFPERFIQISKIQEEIGDGAKFLRNRRTGERIFLSELDPTHGRIQDEPEISCSFFREMAKEEIT